MNLVSLYITLTQEFKKRIVSLDDAFPRIDLKISTFPVGIQDTAAPSQPSRPESQCDKVDRLAACVGAPFLAVVLTGVAIVSNTCIYYIYSLVFKFALVFTHSCIQTPHYMNICGNYSN